MNMYNHDQFGHNGGPIWAVDHVPLAPYSASDVATETIMDLQNLFRLRQNMIQVMTKLTLQAQATVRLPTTTDEDFADDDAKAAARKRTEKLYSTIIKDPAHPLYGNIEPFLFAITTRLGFLWSIGRQMRLRLSSWLNTCGSSRCAGGLHDALCPPEA